MTFYRPDSMEMGCERPGLWRIEGYRAERVRADGKTWWQVHDPGGQFVGKRRTLTEACDMIYDDGAKAPGRA